MSYVEFSRTYLLFPNAAPRTYREWLKHTSVIRGKSGIAKPAVGMIGVGEYGQEGALWGQCIKDVSCGLYYRELVERLILQVKRILTYRKYHHAKADTMIQTGLEFTFEMASSQDIQYVH